MNENLNELKRTAGRAYEKYVKTRKSASAHGMALAKAESAVPAHVLFWKNEVASVE